MASDSELSSVSLSLYSADPPPPGAESLRNPTRPALELFGVSNDSITPTHFSIPYFCTSLVLLGMELALASHGLKANPAASPAAVVMGGGSAASMVLLLLARDVPRTG